MTERRAAAIEAAKALYDDGTFLARLATLVAVPTESNPPAHQADLIRYCTHGLGPMAEQMGFAVTILDNPDPQHGPVMLASRIESPTLPTVMIYGHGDVVPRHAGTLAGRPGSLDGESRGGQSVRPGCRRQQGSAPPGHRSARRRPGREGNAGVQREAVCRDRGGGGLAWLARDFAAASGCVRRRRVHSARWAAPVDIDPRRLPWAPGAEWQWTSSSTSATADIIRGIGAVCSPTRPVIMSYAIASILSRDGRILVPGWTPSAIPGPVRAACADIIVEEVPGSPVPDPGWGEPEMTRAERIFMWTSVVVLSTISGQPESPVNAVAGAARARIQVRHTVDVAADGLLPGIAGTSRQPGLRHRPSPAGPGARRISCLPDGAGRRVGAAGHRFHGGHVRPQPERGAQHRGIRPIGAVPARTGHAGHLAAVLLWWLQPARSGRTRARFVVPGGTRPHGRSLVGHRRRVRRK